MRLRCWGFLIGSEAAATRLALLPNEAWRDILVADILQSVAIEHFGTEVSLSCIILLFLACHIRQRPMMKLDVVLRHV